VCCEWSSTVSNVRHLLNEICAQIKNEHILNGFALRKVHIITRNDNQLVKRYVDSPAKFELLIQMILIYVFNVSWLNARPFILFIWTFITFNISANCFQLSVHNVPACVLVHTILWNSVNCWTDTRILNVIGDNVVVKLFRYKLHFNLFFIIHEAYDLVEYIHWLG